ncbi:MAG: DUF4263 domain-containing protein [Chloroflexi bacterium]|nr:DUF4263 domain-containing protein [Chloroflexota bacterium]
MKEHPALLFPTHTHVWPKLPLGARATDFIFRDATGDYLLVELEKSTHPLFLKDGHTSRELNHARGQISDWKRYLEDNLSTVQRELSLVGISINPQSLIVIGRSQSLSDENRRKLVTLENESPRTKIMTYDDVLETQKQSFRIFLGRSGMA